jgi:hypothetical protein
MIRYSKYGGVFFNTPSDQGGGGGNPSQPQQASDPFAGLDLDDLPESARSVIQKSKEDFATLQKSAKEAQTAKDQAEQRAREFQSRHDQLAARVQHLKGDAEPQSADQKLLAQIEGMLVKRGVSPEQAKAQAPLMTDMFQVYGDQIKNEIGATFAPLANSVLLSEATAAWNEVTNSDPIGALQIPEVANETWKAVQQMVRQGQAVDPSTVRNLRNMIYVDHIEKTGTMPNPNTPPTPNLPVQPMFPNIGRPGFGGGNYAARPVVQDPNPARTSLNEDTRAALAATFAKMGTIPKAFKK